MNLYKNLAKDFAESRPVIQPGWQELNTFNLPPKFKVLDVGCANGRLYPFLQLYFPDRFEYVGIDNSPELLALGQAEEYSQAKYFEFDLTEPIARLEKLLKGEKFDLITVYATMHHIPKFEHRLKIMESLPKLLNPGGLMHVSFWQFGEFSRYHRKIGFTPDLVGMAATDMEPGDYIMSWDRGGRAYRFCHWARSEEIEKYNVAIKSQGLELVKTYRADGRENNQNLYYLWEKIEKREDSKPTTGSSKRNEILTKLK
jgi:tRNA (uracil-5-)-methyltransferase TRM9